MRQGVLEETEDAGIDIKYRTLEYLREMSNVKVMRGNSDDSGSSELLVHSASSADEEHASVRQSQESQGNQSFYSATSALGDVAMEE
jgi:hypothetical protein